MSALEKWISAETWQKEDDFRGLLRLHLPACRGILSRHPSWPPYLYMDLHGGPGWLSYKGGPQFAGSPLIAVQEILEAGLQADTLHFEHDPAIAHQLHSALYDSLMESTTVCPERFEDGVARWLAEHGRQWNRLGLVYSDPIGDPIPVDTFNLLARQLPMVDLLAYVAANNQYKRANGAGYGHGRRLTDDIAAVNKRRVLIRTATTAKQYTFILWSNWDRLPEWSKRGFRRLDSPSGQEILAVLDCTQKELHAQRNVPLPFSPTAPTLSTSATPDSSPSARWSSSGRPGSVSAAASGQPPNLTTSPIRPGEPSMSPRTSSPSAIPATAERTGRSGESEGRGRGGIHPGTRPGRRRRLAPDCPGHPARRARGPRARTT
jgi:hypothetical protein